MPYQCRFCRRVNLHSTGQEVTVVTGQYWNQILHTALTHPGNGESGSIGSMGSGFANAPAGQIPEIVYPVNARRIARGEDQRIRIRNDVRCA